MLSSLTCFCVLIAQNSWKKDDFLSRDKLTISPYKGYYPGMMLGRYRFSRNRRRWTVDSQSQMLPRPLNAALYHAGDIGRARAAARVLRIFRVENQMTKLCIRLRVKIEFCTRCLDALHLALQTSDFISDPLLDWFEVDNKSRQQKQSILVNTTLIELVFRCATYFD